VRELHYLCFFDNIGSILQWGIVSKNEQRRRFPAALSFADPELQKWRAANRVPNGLPLYDYVNLYFDASNAMLLRLRAFSDTLAILRISPDVIDFPGTVVSDRNASAEERIFRPAASGIPALNEGEVYSESWHGSQEAQQKRCAELLVPGTIPPESINGAFVRTDACRLQVEASCPPEFAITVDPNRYF
jgi:ssDNA thymidine ADP-ribosyltransferase, DarT